MNTEIPPVKKRAPKVVTSGGEWAGIAVVIILTALAIFYIIYYLKPKLFSGTKYVGPSPPSSTITCPTSLPPTGLTASIVDNARASFDASWNAVLATQTSGETVLGYNVFINTTPNISISNTKVAGFTPVPFVRALTTGSGKLAFSTTYYFRVQTVDSCGPGALSSEEFMIAIP
jgi:hypothetical protein